MTKPRFGSLIRTPFTVFFLFTTVSFSFLTQLPEDFVPLKVRISQLSPLLKGRKGPKPDSPDRFVAYHRAIRTRFGDSGPRYESSYKIRELARARTRAASMPRKTLADPWVERGPGNVAGRTRGFIVDPSDPSLNTWFAGSVGGGIWKTTNGGAMWANKTPTMPNLSTVSLAMAQSDQNVIYAGTGEGYYNADAIKGDGIWRSTDRGETWNQLASTSGDEDFFYVNRLIVDPIDPNIVLAATNTGIFRSSNGGTSWSSRFKNGARVQQILADPTDFMTLYATNYNRGVLKSTDGGLSWQFKINGLVVGNRIELAVAPSNHLKLYAAMDIFGDTYSDLFVSENGGETWSRVTDESGGTLEWMSGQGWYNNTLAVHPYDENTVFLGGIEIHRLTAQVAETSTGPTILQVRAENTESFLEFVNFGLPYLNGGLGTGHGFAGNPTGLDTSDYVSIEIRFGPERSQLAYRFIPPDGPGKTGTDFIYADRVEVPFEVWDMTNNRQLSVSFRDQLHDGSFDLKELTQEFLPREYIFVHASAYDTADVDTLIAVDGGMKYKNIYTIGPALAYGMVWNPAALPTSKIVVTYDVLRNRVGLQEKISDWIKTSDDPPAPANYVHADQHNLTIIPVDSATGAFRLFSASDGGIALSDDGGVTWSERNTGYNTAQFYGVDKKPGANVYIGGTQDNGTVRSPLADSLPGPASTWSTVGSGDGFASRWNPLNTNEILLTIYNNLLIRASESGDGLELATTDMTDIRDDAPFITQLAVSPRDPELLFMVGASGVWRSDDFAHSWTLSPLVEGWSWIPNGWGAHVTVSIADQRVVWAAISMDGYGKVQVSKDGGTSFSATVNYPTMLGLTSGLATHPSEPGTAFALFSIAKAPKILRTTDYGQSWSDLSGFESSQVSTNGFPDVAVYSLLVLPNDHAQIWAGTDIGIVASSDSGKTWGLLANGPPPTGIWEMKVVDDQVVVATHGRGVWSVTMPELVVPSPGEITLAPRINRGIQRPDGSIPISLDLRAPYDSSFLYMDSVRVASFGSNASPHDTSFSLTDTVARVAVGQVVAYRNGEEYVSAARAYELNLLQEPQASYANTFETDDLDFGSYTVGIERTIPPGFSSRMVRTWASGTRQIYSLGRNDRFTLSQPITVRSSQAFIRFDHVAMMVPGETLPPGSYSDVPGDSDFVVVEATSDFLTWHEISPRFDAKSDPQWYAAWQTETMPDSTFLRPVEIDLLQTFSPGTVVSVRFRVHSDRDTARAWGWAMDDLEIQANATGVGEVEDVPEAYALAQNYPNPFNPSTTFRFDVPRSTFVRVEVYDLRGRKVATLADERMAAGRYEKKWDAGSLTSGIYFARMQAGAFVQTRKIVLIK